MKQMKDNKKAPALDRGLKVLELLAEEGSEMGLREIAQKLVIPVPSLWRIMGVLRENGYVLLDEDRKTYRLGFKFLYLGNLVLNRTGFRSEARGYLKKLVELTGETAEFSARVKDQLILIEQVEGPDAVRLFSRVGSAYPYLHATAPGKVYLAHVEGAKLQKVMARMGLPQITPRTITSLDTLEKELESVRIKGYACDIQEMRTGVCRIAAPVYDKKGKVAMCLGIAAPSFRICSADRDRIGNIVMNLAQKLTSELKEKNGGDWISFETK